MSKESDDKICKDIMKYMIEDGATKAAWIVFYSLMDEIKESEQLQIENKELKTLLGRVVTYPKISNIMQRCLMIDIEKKLKGAEIDRLKKAGAK